MYCRFQSSRTCAAARPAVRTSATSSANERRIGLIAVISHLRGFAFDQELRGGAQPRDALRLAEQFHRFEQGRRRRLAGHGDAQAHEEVADLHAEALAE